MRACSTYGGDAKMMHKFNWKTQRKETIRRPRSR
jgi:hypothetical protein